MPPWSAPPADGSGRAGRGAPRRPPCPHATAAALAAALLALAPARAEAELIGIDYGTGKLYAPIGSSL